MYLQSMSAKPTEALTEPERAMIRALVDKHGPKEATRLVGLHAESTLWKALAGAPVHALTVSTIRARLLARAAA